MPRAVTTFVPPPRIIAGSGASRRLVSLLAPLGSRVLAVTGAQSFAGEAWDAFAADCAAASITLKHIAVAGEPSPENIDAAVDRFAGEDIRAVVAWGGGSALDAGKAIAAMLPVGGGVQRFLEGVGDGSTHPGTCLPIIALPTISGTGSEATKNAVLSRPGPGGFKKSLRHDNFVPRYAILDPLLMLSTPRAVTAACGMDALSQLLESFVSVKAFAMTDALAVEGLRLIGANLEHACGNASANPAVRLNMAWGACWSGTCLANAGLGAVHGMAGPLGGRIAVPHGAACGALLAPVMEHSIRLLRADASSHAAALRRVARAGELLSGVAARDVSHGVDLLLETLEHLTAVANIPRLGTYGLTPENAGEIAALSDNKNNPVALSAQDMKAILLSLI